jgi:hypothetical protein
MSVYRLDPIKLNHPRWEASTIKETVWVIAENPKEARDLVAAKTLHLTAIQIEQPLLLSPWIDDKISVCVLQTEPTNHPSPKPGTVINAQGRDVTEL